MPPTSITTNENNDDDHDDKSSPLHLLAPPTRQRPSLKRPNLLRNLPALLSHKKLKDVTTSIPDYSHIPEEGCGLHEYFRTCPSLTRLREEFRAARDADEEEKLNTNSSRRRLSLNNNNVCARPEESTGRLLLHCIGLNSDLILTSTGGSAAAINRVNTFVMQELVPTHPSALIEEDDNGYIPFMEPIIEWIRARRVVRKWKLETDHTREKVELVARKWRKNLSVVGGGAHSKYDSDSDESTVSESKPQKNSLLGFLRTYNRTKIARRELKFIVESCPDAMFCIDEKGIILLTNEAAIKQFGWTRKELVGSNISKVCNKEDGKRHDSYLKRYLTTGEKRVMGKKRELEAMRKDGSTFVIQLGLTEVKLGGGKRVFCGFVKDLTELKKHEDSLRKNTLSSSLVDSMNRGKMSSTSLFQSKGKGNLSTSSINEAQDLRTRDLPPLVEWSLKILSDIVDQGGTTSNNERRSSQATEEEEEGSGDDFDRNDSSDLEESTSDFEFSFSDLNYNNDNTSSAPSSLRASRREPLRRGTKRIPAVGVVYHEIIVEKIAAIPHLLEELLLVEDENARRRVFDLSIVHKILFSNESLGDGEWLINMLDSGIRVTDSKMVSLSKDLADVDEDSEFRFKLKMAEDECRFLAEGAVFYLERISELNIQDDLNIFHKVQTLKQSNRHVDNRLTSMISNSDVRRFKRYRDGLFDTVGALNGLIRRICVLDDDLVKRASVTCVVRRRLDKIIFSPFASSVALFDGINHVLLVLAFRLGPAPALFHLSRYDDTFRHQQYLLASATLMSCVVYFATKTIHLSLAKRALSERLFWSDLYSFWNFLDTVPLIMVFFCSASIDILLRKRAYGEIEDITVPFHLRIAVALTTPFLWLRILAFIKNWNKQLATFILCSVEIVKDIKWFMLVLLVAMASFAQMWISLTYEPGPNPPYDSFSMEGYLKAYMIMLGDIDSESLKKHPVIVLLFIIYTFGVTIVLLNILIAIVSDSYQSSFVSSKMMLGKARIMFVSELDSLKTFHKMWMAGETGSLRRNLNYAFGALSALHVWAVLRTTKLKIQQCSVDSIESSSEEGPTTFAKTCQMDAISAGRLNLEALLIFVALFVMVFMMKTTMAFILSDFDDTNSLAYQEDSSESRLKHAVHWLAKNIFTFLSNKLDSLHDEDERKELELEGGETSSSTASGFQYSNRKIHRSLEKTKKELKHELKSTVEQLQMSLQESEQNVQHNVTNLEEQIALAIAAAVAQSEERIIKAIQGQSNGESEQQDQSKELQVNGNNGGRVLETFDEDSMGDSFSREINTLANVMEKLEKSCDQPNPTVRFE